MRDVNVGLSEVSELKVEDGYVERLVHFGGVDPR